MCKFKDKLVIKACIYKFVSYILKEQQVIQSKQNASKLQSLK